MSMYAQLAANHVLLKAAVNPFVWFDLKLLMMCSTQV